MVIEPTRAVVDDSAPIEEHTIWRRSLLIRGLAALPVSMVPANEPELEFSAV
ncbi:hypothetical protein ACIBQ0_33045 [Nocardia nova]|uniref:hypothetical protein n=1 Tax=Nocardia nova TaxID=37330 RepID=UPI0037932040